LINYRYRIGRFLEKCGYKLARDYRWPEVHGNLLSIGFALLRAREPGVIQVLQIGAFDGEASDPLQEILSENRVSAILVEPQILPYEMLVKRYKANPGITVINAAIADKDGTATLYVPSRTASPKASLMADHHRRFGVGHRDVRTIEIATLSGPSLMKKFPTNHLHILQVDTEGMDYRIINWFFDANIEPDVINFESLHLDKGDRLASRDLLSRKGYWWIETRQDTFAIKECLARPDTL
jgi:FkbM family methyltransferase